MSEISHDEFMYAHILRAYQRIHFEYTRTTIYAPRNLRRQSLMLWIKKLTIPNITATMTNKLLYCLYIRIFPFTFQLNFD